MSYHLLEEKRSFQTIIIKHFPFLLSLEWNFLAILPKYFPPMNIVIYLTRSVAYLNGKIMKSIQILVSSLNHVIRILKKHKTKDSCFNIFRGILSSQVRNVNKTQKCGLTSSFDKIILIQKETKRRQRERSENLKKKISRRFYEAIFDDPKRINTV